MKTKIIYLILFLSLSMMAGFANMPDKKDIEEIYFSIKCSFDEDTSDTKYIEPVFQIETVNSFESKKLRKNRVLNKDVKNCIAKLSKAFSNLDMQNYFYSKPLALDLSNDNESAGDEKIFINDNFIDVVLIIYVKKNDGEWCRIALGNGQYVKIDNNYFNISETEKKKILMYFEQLYLKYINL